jgi:hypothetical protein
MELLGDTMAGTGAKDQGPSQADQAETAVAPKKASATGGVWQSVKSGVTLGAIGTLFLGLIQYYSSYQTKIAALAKDDMTTATAAFTDTLNALSVAQSLQERLFFSFYEPVAKSPNTTPAEDANAQDLYKAYAPAYSSLRENYSILANRAELSIDGAHVTTLSTLSDPITVSALGQLGFDCEHTVPDFNKSPLILKNADKTLNIDWFSSKHHVLVIYYCFNVIHRDIEAARLWASGLTLTDTQREKFVQNQKIIRNDLDSQVSRLNAFMRLATSEIEQMRAQYQPNGLFCDAPIIGSVIGLLAHNC